MLKFAILPFAIIPSNPIPIWNLSFPFGGCTSRWNLHFLVIERASLSIIIFPLCKEFAWDILLVNIGVLSSVFSIPFSLPFLSSRYLFGLGVGLTGINSSISSSIIVSSVSASSVSRFGFWFLRFIRSRCGLGFGCRATWFEILKYVGPSPRAFCFRFVFRCAFGSYHELFDMISCDLLRWDCCTYECHRTSNLSSSPSWIIDREVYYHWGCRLVSFRPGSRPMINSCRLDIQIDTDALMCTVLQPWMSSWNWVVLVRGFLFLWWE